MPGDGNLHFVPLRHLLHFDYRQQLRRLSGEGMTIIMITHEPSIAACADKTFRILDGELRTQEESNEET